MCVCTTCYINGTLRFPFKSHTQLSFTLTMVWEIPRYVVINLRWFRASMIVKIAPSGDLRGRRACCRKRSIEQTNDLLDSHTECNINNKFLLLFPIFSLKAISIVSIHLNFSQRVSPWMFCHCCSKMGLAEQDWSLPERRCLMTSHNYVSQFSTSFPGFYLFSTQALVVTWLPKSGSQKQGRGRRVNCRYDKTFLSGPKRIGSLPPCSLSADGRGI